MVVSSPQGSPGPVPPHQLGGKADKVCAGWLQQCLGLKKERQLNCLFRLGLLCHLPQICTPPSQAVADADADNPLFKQDQFRMYCLKWVPET